MKNASEVRGDMDRSVYTGMCSQVQFIFQVLQLPVVCGPLYGVCSLSTHVVWLSRLGQNKAMGTV